MFGNAGRGLYKSAGILSTWRDWTPALPPPFAERRVRTGIGWGLGGHAGNSPVTGPDGPARDAGRRHASHLPHPIPARSRAITSRTLTPLAFSYPTQNKNSLPSHASPEKASACLVRLRLCRAVGRVLWSSRFHPCNSCGGPKYSRLSERCQPVSRCCTPRIAIGDPVGETNFLECPYIWTSPAAISYRHSCWAAEGWASNMAPRVGGP